MPKRKKIYVLNSTQNLEERESLNTSAPTDDISSILQKFLEKHKKEQLNKSSLQPISHDSPNKTLSQTIHLQASSAHPSQARQPLTQSTSTQVTTPFNNPSNHVGHNSHLMADPNSLTSLRLYECITDPLPTARNSDSDSELLMDPQLLTGKDPYVQIGISTPTSADLFSLPMSAVLPPSQDSRPKLKEKKLATRRSQRLQARRRPTYAPLAAKPRNKLAKLPFNSHSHEIPIRSDAALAILQASSLAINKEIEDMI